MKPTEFLRQLTECYAEKAALRNRHVAVARVIGQYDVNNTYQHVIGREDQHLAWFAGAIADLGGALPVVAEAEAPSAVKGDAALLGMAREDADRLEAFAKAWGPRAAAFSHARHKRMLDLVLGETLEHGRLFRQAAEGRIDLIGRRTGGDRLPGRVMATRWVE